ncbi:hypothetical protein NUV25_17905 [Burkholderia pseudomultivorans]|uniref:hypothetical protein n=1 Tax=Burkholderia pseudomultivorans TaxID=1207504 RepID=UPI002876EFF5|nr:hypothetical protein [Burkholderia pseudomultivorans]MDS0859584.1 hypothetical protein [Burkholderia pseudomultivorans]
MRALRYIREAFRVCAACRSADIRDDTRVDAHLDFRREPAPTGLSDRHAMPARHRPGIAAWAGTEPASAFR